MSIPTIFHTDNLQKLKRILFNLSHNLVVIALIYGSFIYPIQSYATSKRLVELKEIRSRGSFTSFSNHTVDEQEIPDEYRAQEVVQNSPQPAMTHVSPSELIYDADMSAGIIGATLDIADDPFDNLFKIHLDEAPKFNDRVYLEYDLKGLADFTSISRSINENTALGGNLINSATNWSHQSEKINPQLLLKGENRILLNVFEALGTAVQVKNVRFRIEKYDDAAADFQITNSYQLNDKEVYLRGFGNINQVDGGVFTLEGAKIALSESGEFEAVVLGNLSGSTTVELIKMERGVEQKKTIPIATQKLSFERIFKLEERNQVYGFAIKANQQQYLEADGASLLLPEKALKSDVVISIEKLRKNDMAPMGMTIKNVTKGQLGYRFFPDRTTFEKDLKLSVTYDKDLLPSGYKEQDIHIFYFDTKAKSWKVVERDTIDSAKQIVTSNTNHFTDYVAGVIQAPESPESDAFTQTTIDNFPIAHPGDKMNLIEMPSANQEGDAVLSYPIEIPGGRKGLQPNLTVQYNSAGGNGWLGLGWNLGVGSIEVNTKWGAAKYDQGKESESYLVNGEDVVLWTNGDDFYEPHRSSLMDRVKDALFFNKQEGNFNKIQRMGSHPTNYYWIVIDKSGMKYYYGDSGQSRLTTSTGNIGRWMLSKVEDLNGNFIEYNYEVKYFSSGTVGQGKQIYLSTIRYTLNHLASSTNNYKVIFHRTTSPNGVGDRRDRSMTTRLGVKEVVEDVLDQIEIVYEGTASLEVVRKYNFTYKVGAFGKTLLDQIQQKDGSDNLFNTHEFEYYDETTTGLFTGPQTIQGHRDFDNLFTRLNTSASALGGSSSEFKEINGAITAGLAALVIPSSLNIFSKNSTIGVNQSRNTSKSESIIALVDMDGDGLPDKLIKKHNKLYYRKNTGSSFSDLIIPIEGQKSFSKSRTVTKGTGLEAHFFAYASSGKSWSNTETTTFLEDVNADGLVDIISNEKVYFNRLDPLTRFPKFTANSSLTPNALDYSEEVNRDIVEKEKNKSTVDVVRIWVAPKSGIIDISGALAKDATVPSVSFSIEKGALESEGFTDYIKRQTVAQSLTTPTIVTNISVNKGDRIFFRVIADVEYYKGNMVTWDPKVIYREDRDYKDPNGFSPYNATYSEAFLLGGFLTQSIRSNGSYQITWPGFSIDNSSPNAELSDEVTLVVKRYKLNASGQPIAVGTGIPMEVFRKRIKLNELNDLGAFNYNFSINTISEDDEASFQHIKAEIWSDSNVNWARIDEKWKPTLSSIDSAFLNEELVKEMSIFHEGFKTHQNTEIAATTRFKVKHSFSVSGCINCPMSLVYLVVKNGNGEVLKEDGDPHKLMKYRYLMSPMGVATDARAFNVVTGYYDIPVQTSTLEFTLDYDAHSSLRNKIYFEYSSDNEVLNNKLATALLVIKSDAINPIEQEVSHNIYMPRPANQFGTMHLNWGQFAYKPIRDDEGVKPIYLQDLSYASVQNDSDEDSGNPTEEEMAACDDKDTYEEYKECIDNFRRASNTGGSVSKMLLLIPSKKRSQWEIHEQLFLRRDQLKPNKDINEEEPEEEEEPDGSVPDWVTSGDGIGEEENHKAVSIVKRISSTTKDLSAGYLVASGTKSDTKSELKNDYKDVNGDGYPDIIADKIQLTNSRGGLSRNVIDFYVLQKSIASGVGAGASLAGGAGLNITVCADGRGVNANHMITKSGMGVGFGINASFFSINDYTESELIDINGDGLPDLLQRDGRVALNYGDHFKSETTWRLTDLKKTETNTYSGGGGLSLFNGSISAGFSIAKNIAADKVSLIDVNGDGLPDKIVDGNKVSLNTGDGFAPPSITLPVSTPRASDSYSGGVNANATICIYFIVPVALVGPKACVSIGGNIGLGVNKETTQIMDFNGDGYPDILRSDSEGTLTVNFSKIGKTNMLKRVKRPLGATITLDYNTINPHTQKKVGNSYAMPFTKWVMTAATINDGYAGDGQNNMRRSFEYYNGYKDRRERSFLGFGEVITNDLDQDDKKYRSNIVQYVINDMTDGDLYLHGKSSRLRQYYYKKGLVKRSFFRDKFGRTHSEKLYSYKFVQAITPTQNNSGETYSSGISSTSSFVENKRIFPMLSSVTTNEFTYNGVDDTQGFKRGTQVFFEKYDVFGNVLGYRDIGDYLNQEYADLITVSMNYHIDFDRYNVSIPESHNLFTASQRRNTKSVIDARGNITEVKLYQGSSNEFAGSTVMEYDVFGNLISKRNPSPNNITSTDLALKTTIDYEGELNTYPKQVSNSYGASRRMLYNYLFGAATRIMDVYGTDLYYQFDRFGRIDYISDNANSGKIIVKNTYHTDRIDLNNNRFAHVVTERTKSGPNFRVNSNPEEHGFTYTASFVDGLGRVIQTKTGLEKLEDCTGGSGYRFAVSAPIIYDEFGRAVKSALANEEESCTGDMEEEIKRFSAPVLDEHASTSYVYDFLDRVTHTTVNGIAALTVMKYGHGRDCNDKGRFLQEVTLPEGNKTISYFDSRNRLTATKQFGALETLCTNFTYGALGEVLTVTDAMGATTSYEYDGLGRKTYSAHPDKGQTFFTYDFLNQLTSLVTENLMQRGDRITYEYDFQRLKRVKFPNHEVKFDYLYNRVSKQEDQTGFQTFEYGHYGSLIANERTIIDPLGNIRVFKMKFAHGYWGQTLFLEYPDGEKLHYVYDGGGALKKIFNDSGVDYIKDIRYDHLGNQIKVVLGNDVVTESYYGLQSRLRATTLRRPTNEIFQQNEYWYDRNNNVTKLSNEVSLAEDLDIGGVSSKSYSYDAYNRLTEADTDWTGKREVHKHSLKMKYNQTHGIVEKNQRHRVYNVYTEENRLTENEFKGTYQYLNPEKPHAVSHIRMVEPTHTSLHSYIYDKNGNLTQSTETVGANSVSRNLYWDAQDRLQAVVNGNEVSYYVYDAAGERVIKSLGNAQNLMVNGGEVRGMTSIDELTIYPSGYLVYSGDKYTKHYYSNSQRIASQVGDVALLDPLLVPDTEEELQARVSDLQRQMSTIYQENQLGVLDFQARETNSDSDCETELYILLEEFYGVKNTDCFEMIKNLQQQGLSACEILNDIKKTPCWVEPCKLEYEEYLGYLASHNNGDCVKKLEALIMDGLTYCEAIVYMRVHTKCLTIRTETDCYLEFMAVFNECTRLNDYLCVKYLQNLLMQGLTYCDIMEIVIESEYYVDYPPTETGPGKVEETFPPVEEPEVEPGDPVQEPDPVIPIGPIIPEPPYREGKIWWYHGDHLGSSSYLTDVNGMPTHYYEYLPFGEMMVEHNNSNFDNIYKFNAKELDEQTGYYYYGARYYNPRTSVFLSVDPLAEDFPGWTPYHYVHNNPINLIDPTGMFAQENDDWIKNQETGEVKWFDGVGKEAESKAEEHWRTSSTEKPKVENLGSSFFGTRSNNAVDNFQIEKEQDNYLRDVSNRIESKSYGKNEKPIFENLTYEFLKSTFSGGNSKENNNSDLYKDIFSNVWSNGGSNVVERKLPSTFLVKGALKTLDLYLGSEKAGLGSDKVSRQRADAVHHFKTQTSKIITSDVMLKIRLHKF
ncbi:SpvB/TcaC N-terminal domain-containing protein [Flavobacterium sp. JP2137]|uniref:SpvB/TcaC N-terminal domain-containing protein n=1 Tax=Flavobacterium sp. JP2137 TaxID=3414510 RepID=UPI003D2FF0B2